MKEKILNHNNEMQRINNALNDCKETIKLKDTDIKILKKSQDEFSKKIFDLSTDIIYQDETIRSLQKTLGDKDGRIHDFKDEIQRLKAANLEINREINELKGTIDINFKAMKTSSESKNSREFKIVLEETVSKFKDIEQEFVEMKKKFRNDQA
jgi:chromosome segregation ATPase